MSDRKELINDLERCIESEEKACPSVCPFYKECCLSDNFHPFIPIMREALKLLKEQEPITGETSDGYHTFNELYHHRAVLFSVIVANYPERAWKSKKHNDGTMYDGMFIVGIETPDGQATYHYDIDPYWDMFKCRVLDKAPEWDGHTPAQAIERIGKLKDQSDWISIKDRLPDRNGYCLTASKAPAGFSALIKLLLFTKDLHRVDPHNFEGMHRPGWCEYDHEWGYFEHDAVTHWMPLPKPPEGE